MSEADVIVVGGGPAGASTSYYLARQGYDVTVLEKSAFPREKVCGDGLTPRAVGELIRMGIDTTGWSRNLGIRGYGAGNFVEVPWPELASMPSYGLAKRRRELDHILIKHAVSAGVRLEEKVQVTGALHHERTGRVVGVKATKDGETCTYRARYVVDAGGVSARLATSLGRIQNRKRPMGVAYRSYMPTPLAQSDFMESQLELWEGEPGKSPVAPGYGWAWAVEDGVVNVGLGSLSSKGAPKGLDYKAMFSTWMKNAPEEWEFSEDKLLEPLRGAALPMAFNRQPLYADGLLLVGDAGGMVSPFNGEGIAYALQSGRLAADALGQALSRTSTVAAERALAYYAKNMKDELGGYYSLGRVFAALIERPEIMHICVKYGLPRPTLMRFVMRLLSDAYDKEGGDWMDRIIASLAKVAPKA